MAQKVHPCCLPATAVSRCYRPREVLELYLFVRGFLSTVAFAGWVLQAGRCPFLDHRACEESNNTNAWGVSLLDSGPYLRWMDCRNKPFKIEKTSGRQQGEGLRGRSAGERYMYMGCVDDLARWVCIRMYLPSLRGYLALRGVGGFLTRRLKRIGWRLDLTPSPLSTHHHPPTAFTRFCSYLCS